MLWGNFDTPRSHSSAEAHKLVRNPRKLGIERLKVQTLGLSTPLLHIGASLLQLMPLGICRLIFQGVGKMLAAGKEMLEEGMATSLTGEIEMFSGMNACWEEYRRNSKCNFELKLQVSNLILKSKK